MSGPVFRRGRQAAALGMAAALTLALVASGRTDPTSAAHSPHSARGAALAAAFAAGPLLSGPQPGSIPGAVVNRDLQSGTIRRIRGHVRVPGARSADEAAAGFLQQYGRRLGLAESGGDIRPLRRVESLAATHFVWEQVYAGLPVFGGRLSVHVGHDGTVRAVNQDMVPVTQTRPVLPPRNPAAAIRAALRAVGSPGQPEGAPQAAPGVAVQDGVPVSAWRVTWVTQEPGADWDVVLDAASSRVISLRNRASYRDGQCMIFYPNPIQSSGNPNLQNNNNRDSPELNSQRFARVVHDLDGSGFLQGLYVTTAPTSTQSRARDRTFRFNYTRSDPRFDEVMAYWWCTESQRYLQSLGFKNVNNRQTPINVNGTRDDNSFFTPSSGRITFGSGGVHDAQDADVILHEYAHAIQDNQVPGYSASFEAGALLEGFGNYWAMSSAAAAGGPQSPAWDVFWAKWDASALGPGNPPFLRRLDSTRHYPEDLTGEIHADGELWSSSLWQIHQLIGRTRSDTLALEAHFAFPPGGRFVDQVSAFLAANEDFYGGADQDAIEQVFIDRGFLSPPVSSNFGLRGRVATTAGKGVAGVTVEARSGGTVVHTRSQADGSYALEGLAAGDYTIKPIIPDVEYLPVSRLETLGPDRTGIDFAMAYALNSLTVQPSAVRGGRPATGTVTLVGTAPAGGASVGLMSVTPDVATVPPSVIVPAGQSTADFPITTRRVKQNRIATLTASLAGILETARLSVTRR